MEIIEKENKNRVTTYNENQILPNLYKEQICNQIKHLGYSNKVISL